MAFTPSATWEFNTLGVYDPAGPGKLATVLSWLEREGRNVPGDILEAGCFRGRTLLAFALFLRERGIDKIRGRFMVLRVAPFDSEGDVAIRGDLVTVIFDKPPHWMFTVSVVYQSEDRFPAIWGFYLVEMTAEKQQQLVDNLSAYLKDDSFTR